MRSDRESAAVARAETAAIQAAKDCVSATQAPDTNSMLASQRKIIDCATGDFGAQAALYSGVLVDAYEASKAQVQLSDLRAAVERHNPDGSMDILVALRIKLSNYGGAGPGRRVPVTSADGAGQRDVQDRPARPGDEVTAVVDEAHVPTTPDDAAVAGPPIAPWSARAGAFGIDVLLGSGALASALLVAWSTARGDWRWWVCVSGAAVVLLAIVVNRLLLPVLTGWSAGRALFGIAVVDRDGAAVGPWRLLARDGPICSTPRRCSSAGSGRCGMAAGRTFADLLTRTEVHRREPSPAGARRRVAVVAGAAALIAVAAATLGYTGVYRHDLRVAQAREQIAVAGPKIVEQMLSYDPATLPADFGRAQSLVTADYRPKLVAEQQAVEKARPVANVYWVTNGSVLTSTENTATMLLLMQGQRGAPPNQRGITATVKVDFDRVGADWRVGNLTVLAKPKPDGPGK